MKLIIKESKEINKYGKNKAFTFKFINPYNRQLQKVILVNKNVLLSWLQININGGIEKINLI